ncbi:hypothetical protein [Bdellovibrio svalbardensis]|uniref:Lipoprotein n=1 Tax=Bdellovibrio svalbardensis TaxID=2972972 RepID=A0ABT6DH51_9BACT|nr:hypothetical protein [Bdellovibrio svalbardensis]MDG0815585.1 hypothetical protein [Bdellovibrio svalbardensis]
MFSKKFAAVSFFIGLSSLLAGCEQETTKDQVADAQYCLDKATDASSANACVAKIASINTPTANALRCSAGFIAAGVTKTENLSKALTAIKDSNSGGSSATAMMSFLNLGSNADATFDACVASQNKGMALVAAMAKTATTLIALIPSFDPDTIQADLETEIANLAAADPNDPAVAAKLESVGSAIATVYQATCSGSNNANSDICGSIDDALASLPPSGDGQSIDLSSTSPAEIGKQLVDFWKAQNL